METEHKIKKKQQIRGIVSWFLRIGSPIWWQFESLFDSGIRSSRRILLILSTAIIITLCGQLMLRHRRIQFKQKYLINAVLSIIATAIMLEISVNFDTRNPWQQQGMMILHFLNFQDLQSNLIAQQMTLLLFGLVYAIVRIFISVYIMANVQIVESLQIMIGVLLIVVMDIKITELRLTVPQGNYNQELNLFSVDRGLDREESPNFMCNNRDHRKDHAQLEAFSSTDARNGFNTFRFPSVNSIINKKAPFINKVSSIKQHEAHLEPLDDLGTDTANYFYHSLLNSFPHGIVLINYREDITFANNTSEKLLSSGPDQLKEKIMDVILHSKIVNANDKRTKGSKVHQNAQIYIDIVRTAQLQNNKNELIQNLLDPTRFSSLMSPSESRNSKFQQQSSWISLDIASLNPSITLRHVTVDQRPKYLKIKIIQCFMKESLQNSMENLSLQRESPTKNELKPMLLFIIKNITAKQTLQTLKNEYEFQNSLLQSFSHELRTPLNCSIQLLNVVKEMVKDKENIAKYIRSAISSNQLLIYQINDILDFAAFECKKFQYKWESILFKEMIDEVFEIYRDSCEEKQINLQLKIDESLLNYRITTDPSRVIQVLVNLMNNAIKFTQNNGKIFIKGKIFENINGKMIRLEVKDNGHGINNNLLRDIQTQLRHNLGMVESIRVNKQQRPVGLGVTISNKIVSGLADIEDNHLQIHSNPSKGTKVYFFIRHRSGDMGLGMKRIQTMNPFDQSSPKNRPKLDLMMNSNFDKKSAIITPLNNTKPSIFRQDITREARSDSVKSMASMNQSEIIIPVLPEAFFDKVSSSHNVDRVNLETPSVQNIDLLQSDMFKQYRCKTCVNVLIVDDVPFNQLALKAMLKLYHLECDQAHDGSQAVKLVTQKLVSSHCRSYQLVFMDIEMPGLNGFQTTAQIHKILSQHQLLSSIIMCSAYDTADNFEMAKKVGMTDALSKPVKKTQLDRIIRKFLVL